MSTYTNSTFTTEVTNAKQDKIEFKEYSVASNGSVSDCHNYLAKYPNGRYASEINTRKNRLYSIRQNSRPSLWTQGDRICTSNNPNGQIQAVVEQWNNDRSKVKVKILAGYDGLYQGEDIYKGNMIWITTDGWYECLGDENLNYDIPSSGIAGGGDRNKYKYSVGDLIKCRMWENGNAGYNATILDKKEGKYFVKVTKVVTHGWLSNSLNPSKCSGHVRLMEHKEYLQDEGVGSTFWVDKSCVE